MPFSTTGSVVSTDLDNMLRGLYRDNSDSTLTATAAETTLKSVSIAANTIGPTGGLHIIASGNATGAGGTKTIRFYFGTAVPIGLVVAANSQDWVLEAWIFNTATNAQRMFVFAYYVATGSGTPTLSSSGYVTAVQDTTANVLVKITGQQGSAGDTTKQTMFDVFVVQIT